MREIVAEAKVSKPVLYYYFADKAAVFEALVKMAHNERYRLMREASQRGASLASILEEIVTAIFGFTIKHRELMRLAFATAFSPAAEVPGRKLRLKLVRRNFDYVRSLIERAQASGELRSGYSSDQLAMGIYGQINSYVMAQLLVPGCPLDREAARTIVGLFMHGAANRGDRLRSSVRVQIESQL